MSCWPLGHCQKTAPLAKPVSGVSNALAKTQQLNWLIQAFFCLYTVSGAEFLFTQDSTFGLTRVQGETNSTLGDRLLETSIVQL